MSRALPLVAGITLAWLWSVAGTVALAYLVDGADTETPVLVYSGGIVLLAGLLAALLATLVGARSSSVPDPHDSAIGAAFGAAGYLVLTSLLTLASGAIALGFVQMFAGVLGPAAGGVLGLRAALR